VPIFCSCSLDRKPKWKKEIWGTGRDSVNPNDSAEMGAGSDYSGNEMNILRIRRNYRVRFSLIVLRICAAMGHTGKYINTYGCHAPLPCIYIYYIRKNIASSPGGDYK